MTREEEIIRISIEYDELPMIGVAFRDGVRWADNNPPQDVVNLNTVWHNASEEPQGTYRVLCDGLDYTQWVVGYRYIDMMYANWKDYVETVNVTRWAYISDLLPKGDKK